MGDKVGESRETGGDNGRKGHPLVPYGREADYDILTQLLTQDLFSFLNALFKFSSVF